MTGSSSGDSPVGIGRLTATLVAPLVGSATSVAYIELSTSNRLECLLVRAFEDLLI